MRHLNSALYCNHADTFLDITKTFRDELVECQNLNLVKQERRLLNIVSLLLLEKRTLIKCIIKFYYNIYTFVQIYIFKTHTEKNINTKSFYLEEYIIILYNLLNLKVNVHNIGGM